MMKRHRFDRRVGALENVARVSVPTSEEEADREYHVAFARMVSALNNDVPDPAADVALEAAIARLDPNSAAARFHRQLEQVYGNTIDEELGTTTPAN